MDTIYGDGYTCTFVGYTASGKPKYACICHATNITYNFYLLAGWTQEQCATFIANNIKYDCPPAAPITCDQQFTVVDVDTGIYITGASVEVGGVGCTEYPSIERYIIYELLEGSWYNVIASKAGYTCPNDICKDTFQACSAAIVLKLKAVSYLTIIPATQNVSAAGGPGTIITVESNVSWTASTDKTWLHINTWATSGSGFGTVSFTVDENPGTDTRTGTITIAGDIITRTCTITQPGSKIIGDITKVTLDGKLLPESGTLNWILYDDAHVKVFFKNISATVAGPAHIWLTDETGATLTGCDVTTGDIPANSVEYVIDLCVFLPDIVKIKTLTAHIDP